jgi:YHS domain-containing protein
MSHNQAPESDSKPVCGLPLCGKEAYWEVELFGKVEYFCERHRPHVPEKFMVKVKPL